MVGEVCAASEALRCLDRTNQLARTFSISQPDAKAARMVAEGPARATEWTDESLLEAVACGQSRSAFHELFRRYAPRLKAYYVRAGQPQAQAEDLAQDVLVSVWHHASSYRSERGAVSTWIFRIARNRFIDVVRRRRYVPLEEPQFESAEEPRAPGADEVLETEQLTARIAAAVGSLSSEQAEVVQRSYYGQESAAEMAESLRIPIGTVKSRLRAALAKLQHKLFEDGQS